jgi:hypothetical protein
VFARLIELDEVAKASAAEVERPAGGGAAPEGEAA